VVLNRSILTGQKEGAKGHKILMSAHYSKFDLNTYYGSDYFQAHVPADYPLHEVLEKSRAFRRLPPRLRELSALAKKWDHRVHPITNDEQDQWYDDEGYELNPDTGKRLTDDEIDDEWERWDIPDIEIEDIPLPAGGFADPDTWEPAKPPPDLGDREGLTEDQILSDIATRGGGTRGREDVAEEYGVPKSWLTRVTSDKDLARMVLDMDGKPWPARE